MKTILAVTDELELVRNLEHTGCRVVSADDGQTALTLFRHEQPNLVLLDLALPGLDGLAVCRQLRQASDAPILVLTAYLEEAERVVGQEVCADDFVLKPFSLGQAVARIRALLHWAERQDVVSSGVIRVGDLELNPAHHRATVAGKPVDLTRTELALLAALAVEPGRAFTRSQLMGALNGNRGVSERTIDSHIRNLRAKIEPNPRHPRYVLTVYGVGYKLSG